LLNRRNLLGGLFASLFTPKLPIATIKGELLSTESVCFGEPLIATFTLDTELIQRTVRETLSRCAVTFPDGSKKFISELENWQIETENYDTDILAGATG
jgi:hypothetical protein